MDLGFRDKVVLIAGASRGIGLACAAVFLREGARVAVTARQAEPLERAARTLRVDAKDRVLAIAADMGDAAAARGAVERVVSELGSIDVAVANVGSGSAPGGWDLTRELWQSVLDVNLLASTTFATAVVPQLKAAGGNLVFVSSIAGREAIAAPIPYGAAKAALESAVKGYARVLGAEGIRVNAVVPGNVLAPGGSWERKLAESREQVMQYVKAEVPLARFASPEEIADAVAFLASDRAGFITGACLVVDGGQTRSW